MALPSATLWRCPPDSCRGLRLTKIKFPAKKIVFQEPVFNPSFNPGEWRTQWHYVGRNHSNLLYADLHVSFTFCTIFQYDADPNENNPYY